MVRVAFASYARGPGFDPQLVLTFSSPPPPPHPLSLSLSFSFSLSVSIMAWPGEYVFDHSWANAYGRLTRKNYYPKLQSCVPFSPVTGSRLLAKSAGLDDQQRNEVLGMMAGSLVAIADEMKVSSLHVTFNSKEELAHFSRERGYLTRTVIQYHWQNNGYDTFNDFLMELRQSKRKSIRQERKCAEKNGLRGERVEELIKNCAEEESDDLFCRKTKCTGRMDQRCCPATGMSSTVFTSTRATRSGARRI